MALHQIYDPYMSKWGVLGSEFGTGLGEGVSQLAQMKLKEVTDRKQQKQMSDAYEQAGIPRNIAHLLPRVSEKERSTFLSGWAQTQAGQPQAQGQMEQVTPQQARQYNMQQGYKPAPQPQAQMQQTLQQQLAASARPASVPELLAAISPSGKGLAGVGGTGQPFGPQLAPPPQEVVAEQAKAQARQNPQNRIPIQATQPNFADIYAAGAKTPQERIAEKKMEQAERHFQQKQAREQEKLTQEERKAAFQETRAERKAIIEDYNKAKDAMRDLERFEELEQEGKLDTPGYVEFLKRSGLDIPALMNEGSEEFQKIANNFTRDAKNYFGGRVSNFEVEQFLKTIPSLSQSPEGRKRVISNLKNLQRGKIDYYDSYKKIMAKNKNVPPLDLLEQVQDDFDVDAAKRAEKFKKDLAKPVPAGQNKLITAIQAGLGSIIGAPGKAFGSAKGLGGLAELAAI